MRALIIGYGSIGERHGRLLKERGVNVACLTNNVSCPFQRYSALAEALIDWRPSRIVVSNATASHAPTLVGLEAAGYRGPVMVEKPLFGSPTAVPATSGMTVYVAYNLRFHPLIQRLRDRIAGVALYNASFHAGQYLPNWRPGLDYRKCYSAKRELGGGVLKDLSHELDLAIWLCGSWLRVAALGGRFSNLEIDSDDTFCLLAASVRCPALAITLNYLDRLPRRTISINGEGLTATLDLIAGTLVVNEETIAQNTERDCTYRAQMKAFLDGDDSTLCRMEEGLEIDRLIAATEKASASGQWVSRGG